VSARACLLDADPCGDGLADDEGESDENGRITLQTYLPSINQSVIQITARLSWPYNCFPCYGALEIVCFIISIIVMRSTKKRPDGVQSKK